MIPHTRFGTVCDLIGSGALMGAIGALGSLMFHLAPEATAFSAFFTFVTVAVGAFGVARLVDIGLVLANHQDPRRQRAIQIPASNLATVQPANVAGQESDLPRAA